MLIFAKWYTPNWSKEAFFTEKVKNIAPDTYVFSDLNSEKLLELFTKKNCKTKLNRV